VAERDDDWFRKYLDAGAALGQSTKARAEAFVKDLTGSTDEHPAAKQRMDEFIDRGRKVTEGLLNVVRTEVAHQVTALGVDTEHLGNQVAEVLRRTAAARRPTPRDTRHPQTPFGAGTWTAPDAPTPGTDDGGSEPALVDSPADAVVDAPADVVPLRPVPEKRAVPAKKAASPATSGTKKATAVNSTATTGKVAATKAAPAKRVAPAKKTAAAKAATAAKKATPVKRAAKKATTAGADAPASPPGEPSVPAG
jgi:hypothetical protein